MAKIHSDKFGVYVRANASIHRPGDSLQALCDHYNISLRAIVGSFSPFTMKTSHTAGSSGVFVKNVRETPYVNVEGEYWINDGLTPYSDYDVPSLPTRLAFYRVKTRLISGESIAHGEEWRNAEAVELEKILANNEI